MKLFLLSFLLGTLACVGDILEWSQADTTLKGKTSVFHSVDVRRPEKKEATAAVGGAFLGDFTLAGLTNSTPSAEKAPQAVVVHYEEKGDGIWTPRWASQTFSEAGAAIVDVVMGKNDDWIFVTGTYDGETVFGTSQDFILPDPGRPNGFVGILSEHDGKWLQVFSTQQFLPSSIEVDREDHIYLTGPDYLLLKLTPNGDEVWSVEATDRSLAPRRLALELSPEKLYHLYVQDAVLNGANTRVTRISQFSNEGELKWSEVVNSEGGNQPGGIAVPRPGLVTFAYSSASTKTRFGEQSLAPDYSHKGVETFVVRLNANGKVLWSTPTVSAQEDKASMTATDLRHDPRGNAHLAVNFQGLFLWRQRDYPGKEDTGVLTVGDGGVPYQFLRSEGNTPGHGRGIAALDRERQVLVGDFGIPTDGGELTFPPLSVSGSDSQVLFAATHKKAGQSCFIIRQPIDDPTPPDAFLDKLRSVLEQHPGAPGTLSSPAIIYRELNFPDLVSSPTTGFLTKIVGFAAFLSLQDVDFLASSGEYVVEEDLIITPSGTLQPASYNLAKLNSSDASAPYSFDYPELCQPVKLYLIDTAVYDPGNNYFASNDKLTLLDPLPAGYGELLRAPNDTHDIVTSEHGTNVLSLIAGPGHGVAPATPITTKIFDIFPDANTARVSALIEALLLARDDYLSNSYYQPATILAAVNSVQQVSAGDLPGLNIAIHACSDAQLPLIFAAGNNGGLASDYAPSQFATYPGVLCVGASRENGSFYTVSNYGPEVDLLAPGHQTWAASENGGNLISKQFSGTSASAALATGAFLQFQAANPWLRSHALVASFLQHSRQATTISYEGTDYPQARALPGLPPCLTGYADWVQWFDLNNPNPEENEDNDAYDNLREYVHGLHPHLADPLPYPFCISPAPETPEVHLTFPLAGWLWDPAATGPEYLLRDGQTCLTVLASNDLVKWEFYDPALTEISCKNGQSLLQFSIPTTDHDRAFFRLWYQADKKEKARP
ncbi:S8 family serine peptidase [Roseibacillus ishigakijimensis]|uniref:S8 family serine peptidase n=1 Tax=Roseibacillus ishigakijimensis TaxID=454146 RepID=A0A934RN23_9BACT|nr:S8 family serine peptidase [Roseibacillus ishigakijimensis]MBK1833828.1 S8 family serine peptidase [Roseibacillus ishigakijimensis]